MAKTKFLSEAFYVEYSSKNETSVSLNEMVNKTNEVYTRFDEMGYDVVSVTPLQTGGKRHIGVEGVGHGVTRGMLIVGKLREENNGL